MPLYAWRNIMARSHDIFTPYILGYPAGLLIILFEFVTGSNEFILLL